MPPPDDPGTRHRPPDEMPHRNRQGLGRRVSALPIRVREHGPVTPRPTPRSPSAGRPSPRHRSLGPSATVTTAQLPQDARDAPHRRRPSWPSHIW